MQTQQQQQSPNELKLSLLANKIMLQQFNINLSNITVLCVDPSSQITNAAGRIKIAEIASSNYTVYIHTNNIFTFYADLTAKDKYIKIIKTLCHELKHIEQIYNNRLNFDKISKWQDRWQEVEAENFADDMINKMGLSSQQVA